LTVSTELVGRLREVVATIIATLEYTGILNEGRGIGRGGK
jgi:hypothetical protein